MTTFNFAPISIEDTFAMTPERKSLLEDMGISLSELVACSRERQAARPAYDICLYETPVNNHGCCGFQVELVVIDERTARVISGNSCNSCWQVGHDNADSPIPVGTIVQLPDWCASWDEASAPHGRSHNELINDSGEEPQSDCTFVRPSDLTPA